MNVYRKKAGCYHATAYSHGGGYFLMEIKRHVGNVWSAYPLAWSPRFQRAANAVFSAPEFPTKNETVAFVKESLTA